MTARIDHLVRDGAVLRVDDAGGTGLPVVFQHGLCGDARQTADVFPANPDFRRLTLECRGHGSSAAGNPDRYSIDVFSADVAALIEATGQAPVIVGGISMGAAIALRLAVQRSDLLRGLILARPAWVTRSAPDNMQPNAEVGRLLATLDPAAAREAFLASDTAARLAEAAPDNLASLLSFFDRDPHAITAALLQTFSADGPGVSEAAVRAIRMPTLVIGHGRDLVHPLAHAEALASLIPGSRLVTITGKADDRARYVLDFRAAMAAFLENFL